MFKELATWIVLIFIACWIGLTAALFKTVGSYEELKMTAIRMNAAHYDEKNEFIFDGCQK